MKFLVDSTLESSSNTLDVWEYANGIDVEI
jgi:hypothetical protein